MSLLKITGGRVVDPANGIDEVRDVWIESGRVVDAPEDPSTKPVQTLDARGDIVMPGGVDVHCHIAGSKVNAARLMRPEEPRRGGYVARTPWSRSGTLGSVPSSFATGYKYAGLGYTSAVDAAIPPLGARHAHHELRDTPAIDKAFLLLLGNNHYVMDCLRESESSRLRDYVAWVLNATRAYGIKVVNPGGIERWKEGKGNVSSLDDTVEGFGVSPRQILSGLAEAVDSLALPHPVHVHGLNLGLPGNAGSTLDLMRSLDGLRAHLAHIQFHSYGGQADNPRSLDSQVPLLADYVNAHDNLSLDVGQVLFGETTSMTADGPTAHFLHRITGRKWLSHDVENETGCGVVPIRYEDKNYVHALQWAIGLEWFLRVDDPWKVALSTDHPNGGSFLSYPKILALLMDRNHRDEMLKSLPDKVRARSGLAEITREYTLSEIAIITRAGPARMLGLAGKGHLAPGAEADITIYRPDADRERMFSMPRYVLKSGQILVDDGEPRPSPQGRTFHVEPEFDPGVIPSIRAWFDRESSLSFANFPLDEEFVGDSHA